MESKQKDEKKKDQPPKKEETPKETPKNETPNGETPNGDTPKGENSPAPEMSIIGLPSKEYCLKGTDDNDFNLIIYKSQNSIIFHAKLIDDLSDLLYTEETDFEEFHNLNRFFKQYSTIDELFTVLFETLDDKEINISKAEKRIKLSFMVESRGKTEEVSFFLKPEKANTNDIALNLCDKVKELEHKLKEKEEIIEKLKEEIKEIKVELNEERTNNAQKQKDMLDLIHVVKKGLAIGSQIIKYNEYNVIESWIRKVLGKNVKYFNLIFRASRNGYRAEDFHQKCDGKKNTIVVVQARNRKRFGGFTIVVVQARNGKRFGGFTEAKWDKSNGYKTGNHGFLFSLDKREIYCNKNNNYDIYCYSDKGPTFGGGHDLFIDDNCNKNNENYDNSSHSYDTDGQKNALAGTKYFYVEDYEVYQLDLE